LKYIQYLQFLTPACIADPLDIPQVSKRIRNLWYMQVSAIAVRIRYIGDHKLLTNYYFLNTDKKAFFAAERAF
jgi:hypothetical protein